MPEMTCPDCTHGREDTPGAGWPDRVEDWVRERLGRPERRRMPLECRAGRDFDNDGCACTHPWHST